MLTEFDGEPVTGGTLPAEIWKEFVSRLEDDDSSFEPAPYLGAVPTWVVKRDGEWQLDNGYCRGARSLAYFSGRSPQKTADCKPNEVVVPNVVGLSEHEAVAVLREQPLGAKVAYRPAKPGTLPGRVVEQDPRRGGLSAGDEVFLVVSKARFGLIPNFVGSSLAGANRELKRLKLVPRVVLAHGPQGTILRQTPAPGVASAPGMRIRLVVGDGSRSRIP
jgi:hypothetical protein